jgi:hypothetical protein
VDKDRDSVRNDVEVVVVVAWDGEVPHPAVVVRRHAAAVGGAGGGWPVRGVEAFALLQLGGGDPLFQGRSVDCTNWFWVINLRTLRDGGDYGRVP